MGELLLGAVLLVIGVAIILAGCYGILVLVRELLDIWIDDLRPRLRVLRRKDE